MALKAEKPHMINGDHSAMWDAINRLTERMDKVFYVALTMLAGVIVTLVMVLLK
ncbi:hypothetical protein LCGC14_2523390 [marine sediment metagenome]|uniref:Uncharacterized protein n=1 Tax=marine sediment metagenome TaxID=412755 RepID=A0A0F9DP03_9ZZZZ